MHRSRSGTRAEVRARATAPSLAVLLVIAGITGCGDSAPEARSHSVAIRNFQYLPAILEVAVGDTLVWTNEDVVPHTATAADRGWDTGEIAAKGAGRVVIERKGKHAYLCTLHPNMRAEFTAR